MHIYIIFRQVCTIGPSFFNTTSGMHRRPIEGRIMFFFLGLCNPTGVDFFFFYFFFFLFFFLLKM